MTSSHGGAWAARLTAGDAAAGAALRLLPSVLAGTDGESVWLRGPTLDGPTDAALRRVPGLERFHVVDGSLLVREDERVPSASLPPVAWTPVRDTFPVALPVAALAGVRPGRILVRLVRSTSERAAAAIVTTSQAWREWCETAPAARLACLRFAASRDGRVLVLGDPLPPIPGAVAHWSDHDVLAPCGFAPSPDVGGEVLRRVLGLTGADLGLLRDDGTFDVVPAGAMCAATRSAVRATVRGPARA